MSQDTAFGRVVPLGLVWTRPLGALRKSFDLFVIGLAAGPGFPALYPSFFLFLRKTLGRFFTFDLQPSWLRALYFAAPSRLIPPRRSAGQKFFLYETRHIRAAGEGARRFLDKPVCWPETGPA